MDIKEIIKRYDPPQENLIPILHEIQDANEFNYLTDEALEEVAQEMGRTYSEIHGTVTFYSMFSRKPRGRHIIRVCESAPCHIMGATTIIDSLKAILGVEVGETTKCKTFTLEVTECLGICAVAPAMMIDDIMYGNLTTERVHEILDTVRKEG
jgi:NADH-quinone oxidoreductase subunit E